MRVDKVILKAALSTLAAIGILCVLLITTMCFVFPQTMVQVTYDLGMNDASIHFASVSYDRSGEAYYAAFATEVSIAQGYDDKVEEYGEKLLGAKGFADYAKTRDEEMQQQDSSVSLTYQRYIESQVCLAKYSQNKKTEAVNSAVGYLEAGTFPKGNALASVYLKALSVSDTTTSSVALAHMQAISVSGEQKDYLDTLIALSNPQS